LQFICLIFVSDFKYFKILFTIKSLKYYFFRFPFWANFLWIKLYPIVIYKLSKGFQTNLLTVITFTWFDPYLIHFLSFRFLCHSLEHQICLYESKHPLLNLSITKSINRKISTFNHNPPFLTQGLKILN